ncbi:MAG TPA: hypothetical protein DEV98_03420 [Clostridiales bacterium]|nr:hypothetical protein [Clostridiales bacterium]
MSREVFKNSEFLEKIRKTDSDLCLLPLKFTKSLDFFMFTCIMGTKGPPTALEKKGCRGGKKGGKI